MKPLVFMPSDIAAETMEVESPRPYVVGWQRYTVHSFDEATYETRWNVIYTKMRGVGPNEGKLSGRHNNPTCSCNEHSTTVLSGIKGCALDLPDD